MDLNRNTLQINTPFIIKLLSLKVETEDGDQNDNNPCIIEIIKNLIKDNLKDIDTEKILQTEVKELDELIKLIKKISKKLSES